MPPAARSDRARSLIQRSGLALVIVFIAAALALIGGDVDVRGTDGTVEGTANRFLQADNLVGVAKDASFIALLAIGVTLVIVLGGIDLSIGAIYAASAVTTAVALRSMGPTASGWTTLPCGVAIAGLVGAACGAVNGSLVTMLRVHPFIVTLGTMEIFRGLTFVATNGETISPVPSSFVAGGIKVSAFGVHPVPMLAMIAVAIAVAWIQRRTLVGRYIHAIGGNERAAIHAALPVARVKILAYTACGVCAGLSGAMMVGYYSAAGSDAGRGYELNAIAAAVIGGTSLAGGTGSVVGSVLGAILIALIENGISILAIDQNWSRVVVGGAIVLATLLDRIRTSVGGRT